MSRFDGLFLPIDEDECRALLRTQRVGRVGWESANGPQILPINFLLTNEGTIVLRSAKGSILSELADPTDVVLQCDSIDSEARNGWSVLASGRTRLGDATETAVPWAPGERDLIIQIDIASLSGRVIISADSAEE